MKFRRRGDLAFLETVAVGLAVIALGVYFVPKAMSEYRRQDAVQTLGEAQRIAATLLQHKKDTGTFPTNTASGEALDYLKSTDSYPRDEKWTRGVGEKLEAYIGRSGPDPWGHAYVVSARGFREGATERAWVLSAGANGQFDTLPSEGRTSGDDVGVLIQ